MTEQELQAIRRRCGDVAVEVLVSEVRRQRDLIAAVEWDGRERFGTPCCPWCRNEHIKGHEPTCAAFGAKR